MSVYVPRFRVDLEQWCEWTGSDWSKVAAVTGRSFRVCGPHESVYTMAANAALKLILRNQIDPTQIGFLGLGTESSTDNAAGAVIVRGMLDLALERLHLPRLSRNMEVPEFKHACLGGIYALKNALRFVAYDGGGRQAIVVSADVAEYERGSSGEQTQGAGAVAMHVEREPRLIAIDLQHSGSASDYRGPDFRKPVARHFMADAPVRPGRPRDFPVFNGRYSTYSYLDETAVAVERMVSKLGTSAGTYYRDVAALFFHRPYHIMPIQAMSFLYVRGMARGENHHDELMALCDAAGVSYQEVLRETRSSPNLYARVLSGEHASNPHAATHAAATELRKRKEFQELLQAKMSLGADLVKDLGNLYSAALPAWIAAGLEEALHTGRDIAEAPMVAIGYGSGDAAEAIPMQPVLGWEAAASRIQLKSALAGSVALTHEQYQRLHDGGQLSDVDYTPRDEFAVCRVGTSREGAFQDIGVEYYEYAS